MHKAVENVGQDVYNLLVAMHALTECDSMSNLNGMGKKGGFTTLKKHKDDLVGLKNLGTDCTVISNETLTVFQIYRSSIWRSYFKFEPSQVQAFH